jgi:protein-tyrosine phosphatase
MTRLCFVCLGNICRSPTAEGVFKHLVAQTGPATTFHVESAGLGSWHVGEPPDTRAARTAHAHGVTLNSVAQQFTARDFARFDLILALDSEIEADLLRRAPTEAARAKVRRLRAYDPQADGDPDVPDPYYGDQRGFEGVYAMIERSCRALLAELTHNGGRVQQKLL